MRILALALALLGVLAPAAAFLPHSAGLARPRALKAASVLRAQQTLTSAEEAVDKATLHWCATVTSGAQNNWERVTALYGKDALLWGTVSEDLRGGQDLIDYFKYFAHIPGLALKPGSYSSQPQVMGDTAINSGYYTFEIPQANGDVKAVPARFTFVYRKLPQPTADGIEWEIVNHHSSAIPTQPPELSPILAKQ